jgi:DNA polymerase III subunit beta
MKFQIHRDTFRDALAHVQNVVSNRTTLPILSNVLIEADAEGLIISTTDLDMTITKRIRAEVDVPGSTTMPARRLANIVRELPTPEIGFEATGDVATIISGKSRFKVMGLPAGEFPIIGEFGEATEFTLDQNILHDAIRKTTFASSTDESRYILNGLLCVIDEGVLTVVGTDGRRLAMVEQGIATLTGVTASVIIPTKAVVEIQRLLEHTGEIKVSLSENQARFETGAGTLTSRLIEGNYPNYRQVLPASADHRATISRETIIGAVKRVGLLVNEKTNSIKFAFEDNRLAISANSPDVGEAEETIEIGYTGPRIVLALNPEFVMGALRVIDQDDLLIDLINESSPAVIKAATPFLYVIMPMRLAN